MVRTLSFIFCVANGEPPIGIPWETFQKYAKITSCIMREKTLERAVKFENPNIIGF